MPVSAPRLCLANLFLWRYSHQYCPGLRCGSRCTRREHARTRCVFQLGRFAFIVGLIILVLLILNFPNGMWWIVSHPTDALRTGYWAQTKGETEGLLTVVVTFLGYGFVAPEFTTVALPSGAPMLDFREFSMTAAGFIALGLWIALLAMALVGASRANGPIRWLFGALIVTVIYNLLFHMHYQFRGSIFLYTGHVNFAVFAFCSAAALLANEIGGRVRTPMAFG